MSSRTTPRLVQRETYFSPLAQEWASMEWWISMPRRRLSLHHEYNCHLLQCLSGQSNHIAAIYLLLTKLTSRAPIQPPIGDVVDIAEPPPDDLKWLSVTLFEIGLEAKTVSSRGITADHEYECHLRQRLRASRFTLQGYGRC